LKTGETGLPLPRRHSAAHRHSASSGPRGRLHTQGQEALSAGPARREQSLVGAGRGGPGGGGQKAPASLNHTTHTEHTTRLDIEGWILAHSCSRCEFFINAQTVTQGGSGRTIHFLAMVSAVRPSESFACGSTPALSSASIASWRPYLSPPRQPPPSSPGGAIVNLGCAIEAPWLVNGGHGASLRRRDSQSQHGRPARSRASHAAMRGLRGRCSQSCQTVAPVDGD
jgi:hypothetical protein